MVNGRSIQKGKSMRSSRGGHSEHSKVVEVPTPAFVHGHLYPTLPTKVPATRNDTCYVPSTLWGFRVVAVWAPLGQLGPIQPRFSRRVVVSPHHRAVIVNQIPRFRGRGLGLDRPLRPTTSYLRLL
jgi:hypothetical protein